MTDRLKGVLVTFDRDYREDDAESILAAIRMIKGVGDVRPLVRDVADMMARTRVKVDVQNAIIDAVHVVLFPDQADAVAGAKR